jgi:ribose transport system substrate-binding protein
MRSRLLVTGVAVLLLAGSLTASPPFQPAQAATQLYLGAVTADVNDPYFITIECGAKAEAAKLGVRLTWQGSASTAVGDETAVLNTIVATHPDGILLAPFSNTAFVAPVESLMKQGIPVVTVDAPLVKSVQYQGFWTDNLAAGEALAAPLAAAIGNKGLVAILTWGAGNLVQGARYQGLEKAMAAKYPGVRFLTPQYVGVDSAKAAAVTSSLILAHPDLSAIYSTEGPAASGAASALRAAHKQGTIKLFSFDATPLAVQALKAGEIQGLISQSPYLEGVDAVQSLVSYLRKHGSRRGPVRQATPAYVPTPVKFLTAATVDAPSSRPFLYVSTCQ